MINDDDDDDGRLNVRLNVTSDASVRRREATHCSTQSRETAQESDPATCNAMMMMMMGSRL